MKTKKSTSIILAAVMVFSAAITMGGCGRKENKDNTYFSDSFSTIKWPDSTLGKMLPTPESNTGQIETDRSEFLDIYIGSTTQDQYDSYVSQCKETGFTENYDSGTTYDNCPYYRAENSDGYRLSLEYHKEDKADGYCPLKNTMTIELRTPYVDETEPETEKPAEKPTEKPTQASTQAPAKTESKAESNKDDGTVTTSFKEMMDSYEAFFDSYIDFMKKYKENPSDLSMLSEYADYMSKYAEYMDKLSEVEQDDLSAADLAYYTEVYARIMKKMAEV